MDKSIKTALVNYITGQASEEEAEAARQWIRQSPENEAYYIDLYETWHYSLYAERDKIDVKKAYRKFLSRQGRKEKTRGIFTWQRAAAAVLLLIGFAAGVYYYNAVQLKQQTWHVVQAAKGTTKKLVMPDGTKIWLNAGSTLKYSGGFGRSERTVFLDGEAYFDIASKSSVPFLVRTAHFTIRDVGTVFNVKAYSGEELFETAVIEGKVSVEGQLLSDADDESKVFLSARQVLKITALKKPAESAPDTVLVPGRAAPAAEPLKVIQINPSQVEVYNGWRDNLMRFEGNTFNEIVKILERKYDVTIILNDESLKNYKYTGTFKNINDVTKVLNIIRETTPIRYAVNERVINIEPTKKQ